MARSKDDLTSTGSTVPKQLTPWRPGQSGNPAGRQKGSRNKLGEAFIEALHDDFNQNGVAAIVEVRETRPHEYLKVIAGLLPRELKISTESDMTDDELDKRIRQLASALNLEVGTVGGAEGAEPAETAH